MAREHQDTRLELCVVGQWNVHRHLVAVEVRVERGADHRVNTNRFAFDQHRLERLDAETMQCRGAIQKHRMPINDVLQNLPHLGTFFVHEFLRTLHRLYDAALNQLANDERLE